MKIYSVIALVLLVNSKIGFAMTEKKPCTPMIVRLDHLVLTVRDLGRSISFYQQVLGMEPVSFAGGRWALKFGEQKINLHEVGKEFKPNAAHAAAGSADLCFISSTSVDEIQKHLEQLGIEVIEGPVQKTGALGPIRSIYFRDPDGNLIEVSNY